jgi:acetoin utilization protein AcuB
MKFMPRTICPSDSVAHARAVLEEHGIGHLPVLSNGELVGIVSSRDLEPRGAASKHRGVERALETRPDRVPVSSVMTKKVYTAKPKDTLTEAAELMSRKHIGALPIVERGQLEGMLGRGDLADSVHLLRRRGRTRTTAKPARALHLSHGVGNETDRSDDHALESGHV